MTDLSAAPARPALDPAPPPQPASLVIGGFLGFLLGVVAAMTGAIFGAQRDYGLSAAYEPTMPPVMHEQDTVSEKPTHGATSTLMTEYATVRSADQLVGHMGDVAQIYGFARLLCVYEGEKSLMPRQLVRGLARLGRTCLLVELSHSEGQGLTDALSGKVELADIIIRDKVSSAHIIPGGAETGASIDYSRLETALKALQQAYEYVLVSCPEARLSEKVLELAPQVFLTHQPSPRVQGLLSLAEQVLVFSPAAPQTATTPPQHAHISA